MDHYLSLSFFAVMAFVGASLCLVIPRLKILLYGVRTQGHIVEHKTRLDEGSTMFQPVFAFVDHNGTQRHIISDHATGKPSPPIGTKVNIRYLRRNPEIAYIDTFFYFWFTPLVFVVFSAAMLFQFVTGKSLSITF